MPELASGSKPRKLVSIEGKSLMAILTTMEIHGEAEELLARHREIVDPVAQPLAEENGGISHTIPRTDDGIMVVNIWENEGGMEKVAAAVGPKAEAAGLPRPRNRRSYQVLDHIGSGG
jgi:hypothetical protein